MKLFTSLIGHKDYNKLKHLNLEFKEINQLFNKYDKHRDKFVKTIGVLPSQVKSIGKSRIFSYATSMEKEIEWAYLILKLNKAKLNQYIQLERELFSQIFFGNYDEALNTIEEINNNICYSQWAILMKMTILYLKEDLNELKRFTNYLLNECDLESALRNAIFLHNHKLLIEVEGEKDFEKLVIDIEFLLNDYESILINNFGKERFYNEYEILVRYCEKYSMTPFNKKSEFIDLQKLLSLSSKNSLIDLYKTFSIVISELQQNSNLNLDKYVLESIHKSFKDTNLIKVSPRDTIAKKFETLKILKIHELYLKGEFHQVIEYSVKYLSKKPYSIDYLYLFINSTIYLEEEPFQYIKDLKENSLLYKIILNYHNILNNNSPTESLSKLKKILLMFGIQTQWSMYLYHLLFDFLCLHRDTNKKSFSKSLFFSYLVHPRYFYNLTKEQQIEIINLLSKNNKYKDSCIHKIFTLEVYGIEMVKELELSPKYRGDYILSTYEKNIEKIENLYNLENIAFNERIKIIIDYINILFNNNNYVNALELMVKNMQEYKIPLCMFEYKKLIHSPVKSLFNMIEYIYIILLDNSSDMIFIQYAVSNYLTLSNKKYNLPSRLAQDLNEDSDDLDLKLYLLRFCANPRFLEEYIIDITSSKELIEEQLKIYNILFEYEKKKTEKKILQNNIYELENRRQSLNNSNYINKNKLRLNISYIKSELAKTIKSLELFPKLPYSEIDLQDLISKMEYKYIPKIETKEDLVLADLSKVIDIVVNSEYGLFNEIEADIKHGFMEQRLHEPFIKENLVAPTIKGKYVNIKAWSLDQRLQEKLFKMTDEIKLLIEDFKHKYIACNHESSKTNILNFNQKEICSFIDIEALVYNSNLYQEEQTYVNALVNIVLEAIEKLLSNYRLKIENTLKTIFYDMVFNRFLNEIKELKNEGVIVQPVLDAFNNLEESLYLSISDISSWFELYEETIHEHFQLDIILKSNELKSLGLRYEDINTSSSITFMGNTYQMIYRIFFNVFQNVKKHSSSNKLKIIFESIDDFLVFTFSNNISNEKYNKLKLKSGSGENIIRNTVNKLNNSINEDFVRIDKDKSNKYTIKIKLSKKVLINE
jgi:hypothetical protein